MHPGWQFYALPDSSVRLPVGHAGRQVLRLACARRCGESTASPTTVAIDPPLSARFIGEAHDSPEGDSVTITVRDVEVILPVLAEPGPQRSSLRFGWPDGQKREEFIAWEVVPRFRVSPSRLIVKRTDASSWSSVVIRSFDDRAFRIKSVDPAAPVLESEYSGERKGAQSVKLRVNIDHARTVTEHGVRITTDLDDEPPILVKIVILPAGV
jgi:hypothetical protein